MVLRVASKEVGQQGTDDDVRKGIKNRGFCVSPYT